MSSIMKSIYMEAQGKQPSLREIPTPQPSAGQVLIKVDSAPINPSDLGFIRGGYPSKKTYPCVPGFEGSGLVVESGGGIIGWKLKGHRVAFVTDSPFGSYAQYAIADVNMCMELPNSISLAEGCCSFVNPLSVVCMYELVQGAPCVISTAAGSQLGRMLMRYLQQKGVNVINIVRSEAAEKQLREEGAKLVLNSNDIGFDEKLTVMSNSYGATVLFDAIGGEQTGKILSQMPYGSRVYVYGGLAKQDVQNISASDLIFQNKQVNGFWLWDELSNRNYIQLQLLYGDVIKNLKGSLRTLPQKIFQLSEFESACMTMSEKAILKL